MVSPTLTIIAGPNGAGKTTFVMQNFIDEVTQECFVNADQMAYQLRQVKTELTDLEVARQAIIRRDHLMQERRSFLIETTLATLTLKQTIRQAKTLGFHICLYYLWISSPRLCDFRVKDRVSKGGHNIHHFRGLLWGLFLTSRLKNGNSFHQVLQAIHSYAFTPPTQSLGYAE